MLLEVVIYTLIQRKYVCAGDGSFLSFVSFHIYWHVVSYAISAALPIWGLLDIIHQYGKQSAAEPKPVELRRGLAEIPITGIGVPFHSTSFYSGVKPFRLFSLKNIDNSTIDPSKLIGQYISNAIATLTLSNLSFFYHNKKKTL